MFCLLFLKGVLSLSSGVMSIGCWLPFCVVGWADLPLDHWWCPYACWMWDCCMWCLLIFRSSIIFVLLFNTNITNTLFAGQAFNNGEEDLPFATGWHPYFTLFTAVPSTLPCIDELSLTVPPGISLPHHFFAPQVINERIWDVIFNSPPTKANAFWWMSKWSPLQQKSGTAWTMWP